MILKGGPNICGATIGVLCLDSRFPKPPGHIKNPSGLSFPVLYETVKGATVAKLLNEPSPEFIAPFLEAARALEADGVRAITGSCGFLALFQRELAEAVNIPVFASSLIQVPLAQAMLQPGKRVAVLTASANSLTQKHFEAVSAGHVDAIIQGMDDYQEFREVILEGQRADMDIGRIQAEIADAARSMAAAHPEIGAVVLECTDMPPYAHALQAELGLPVFDLTTLTTMVHEAVSRQPYPGLMPEIIG